MLFWGMYVMKVCFSRRKSCCDPMKGCWKWCIGNHWLLRSVCRGGVLWIIHLKVQRTFTRELLDADYLQENSELYWGKMLVFRSNTLLPPQVLIIEGWKFHERKFFPFSMIQLLMILTQKSLLFRALPKSKIPKLRSWRSPIQQQHTKTPRWSGYHYGTMFGGLRIWEDFWNPESWL